MNHRIVRLPSVSACIALLAASAAAASQFKIHIQPVFQGRVNAQELNPLRVELENTGSDATGLLIVSSGQSRTSYPIDLPRGADKALVVFPAPSYEGVHFELDTNQGVFRTDSPPPTAGDEGQRVLMITSDSPGELGFLQATGSNKTNEQQQSQLWDVYAKPDEVPNRPIGYEGVAAIILGPGAERLSDESVEAIKEWVISGHSLLFVGGASAPILSDPRWQAVLPAHDFHPAELANSTRMADLGNTPAPPATITTGTPNLGVTAKMEGSLLVYAEQPLGLGIVVYASFNPFDSPLDKWEGKRAALTHLLRIPMNLLSDAFIRGYSANERTAYGAAPAGGTAAVVLPSGKVGDSDPFNTKLPATGKIFYILGAYFLAVIPLNFLLLKKFKRGELAWVTAPVLSFGFAAILFGSASSLYSAKMSTISTGLLICQSGVSDGIFMGTTQMFVPRAGSYDLKLNGVDSLTTAGQYMPYQESQNEDYDPVDRGQIAIPEMAATNLTFKKVSYHQLVPTEKWFQVHLTPETGSRIKCELSNGSPYILTNAQLAFGAISHPVGIFKPGETKVITVDYKDIKTANDLNGSDVRTYTVRAARAALTGTLTGFRPGPQLGEDLVGRSNVNLVMFSSWQGGSL